MEHLNYSLNRSRHIIHRIKRLRKWLTHDELLKLIIAQYYYCNPLWIGSLTADSWRCINSAHYRALRAILGDHKSKLKQNELDKMSKRIPPVEWAQYSIASKTIKLFNSSDMDIGRSLRNTVYVNDRMPGRGKFID